MSKRQTSASPTVPTPAPDPPRHFDHVFRRARLATMTAAVDDAYGFIEPGALAVADGRIAWLGRDADLPPHTATKETDCRGQLLTPGLIDCHTHLVWGGDRFREFEMRLEGVAYETIARQGGGIVSTVRATRQASEEELLRAARSRLRCLANEGVTTVEIKSGYGLDSATECRMLRVARRLGEELPVRVCTTFLGAHAVPPEMKGRDDAYLDQVIDEMLAAVVDDNLADAVDAFCEGIAFSTEQVERLFVAAKARDLPIKVHAEQLSNLGGAALAARHGALSADHLEYLDEDGVRAMAEAGTVAVLLPGAFHFLRETQRPPVDLLRRYRVPIALATDLNPGSSPVHSLLTTLNLGCLLFGLTPSEALQGVTRHAATALGLGDEVGTLEVGKRADLALWRCTEPAALVGQLGFNPCRGRYLDGTLRWVDAPEDDEATP